ncbi:MAG: anthranilate synthase component I [Candidatus Bathyarchaeia archaeon]
MKWGIAFGTQTTTETKPANPLKIKKINLTQQPLEIFSKLQKQYKTTYLLESIEGPKKLAQYSFIGFDPKISLQTKNGKAQIRNEKTGETTTEETSDPVQTLERLMKNQAVSNSEFRFVGGAVGYISYDAVRYWEHLPENSTSDLSFPDLEMGIFDDGFVFNHIRRQVFYYYRSENRLPEVESLLKQPIYPQQLSYTQPKVNIKKETYEAAVEKAKEYITAGDIFQVVPSKRYQFQIMGNLIHFYQALRTINPSPYMYYYKSGDRQIVGASPEMLVRVENGTVETFPIAGTRPVAQDPGENIKLVSELLADPKERAEHVMLVDLARNDIGRISKFGSVHVPEFMKVHQYSHVQHIVSRVVGQLKDGLQSYDALRAVFPAGTVSGAPKVRAMEIIDELEPVRRGPYAGAVGYFSYNGNADFAITIRTLFADKNQAYIQVGGGIVADSVPEQEWFETEHKAKALMQALEQGGGTKQ